MQPTKVTFFTHHDELKESLPPVPASKFWPDWFKKQKTPKVPITQELEDRGGPQTVKSCPGILDVLNQGYVIPLWSDYKVVRVPETPDMPQGIRWRMPGGQQSMFGASTHPMEQMDAYPFGPETFRGSFKFMNPWFVKTPPGYSCMFVAPYYNKHNNLEIMNGIIDTDKYHEAHINSFFTAPMGEEITFDYGMPICQVIPFKREDYEMEVLSGDHRSMHNKVTQFIHNSMFKAQHYRPKLSPRYYK
jgi:hypothetical protein